MDLNGISIDLKGLTLNMDEGAFWLKWEFYDLVCSICCWRMLGRVFEAASVDDKLKMLVTDFKNNVMSRSEPTTRKSHQHNDTSTNILYLSTTSLQ